MKAQLYSAGGGDCELRLWQRRFQVQILALPFLSWENWVGSLKVSGFSLDFCLLNENHHISCTVLLSEWNKNIYVNTVAWICVSIQSYVKSWSQRIWALGRWVGLLLINGIHALRKETPGSSVIPSALWGCTGMTAVYAPDTDSADLGLPSLQKCEKYYKYLLFISQPAYGALLKQLEQTKTINNSACNLAESENMVINNYCYLDNSWKSLQLISGWAWV